MSCPACSTDFAAFTKLKADVDSFLTEEERETREKIASLQKFVITCLGNNKEPIDWQWLKDNGLLCTLDRTRFAAELAAVT